MLIIGCLVEGIPAMMITLPLLLPLADHFGINRVHFGLIVVYGILIGIATPPVGHRPLHHGGGGEYLFRTDHEGSRPLFDSR